MFLRALVQVGLCPLAIVVCLSEGLGAAPQQGAPELPVSLDRIRDELARPAPTLLKPDIPVEMPIATFKTRVDQRVRVLTLEEWLDKEFTMTDFQRQSADWASRSGGFVVASGAYGIRLDPLLKRLAQALERRKVRKIREEIALELAALEGARRKAGGRNSTVTPPR